jgi:hypothetical protein
MDKKVFQMPDPQYRMIDAVSSTDIRNMARHPKAYWLARHTPDEPTDDMEFGTHFHYALLEPEKFLDLYCCEPDALPDGTKAGVGPGLINRNTTVWKSFIADWREQNKSKKSIDSQEFSMLRRMMSSAFAHNKLGPILKEYDKEMVVLWKDPSTGLSCKGKGDLVGPRLGDIKTTKCTTPKEFNNDCYKRLVHLQTAHYFEGFTNVGVKFQDVPFICGIQKDRDKREPDIFFMEVDETLLARGLERRVRLMDRILNCKESNQYPGWEDSYRLMIPDYALVEVEGDI